MPDEINTGGATTAPLPGDMVDDSGSTPGEHIKRMVDKSESGLDTKGQKKLYAGKYKTEEDLNKGIFEILKAKHGGDLEAVYKSLEREIGKGTTSRDTSDDSSGEEGVDGSSDGEDGSGDSDNGSDESGTDSETDADYTDAYGVIDDATVEFTENGELSEETYEKLSKTFKAPKGIIDEYIEGRQAQAELQAMKIYQVVGGKEAFDSMRNWAAGNMSKEQIQMFNEDIVSGDMNKIVRAVELCNTAFRKANGTHGKNFINTDKSSAGTNNGAYGSLQEFKKDMSDPRYKAGDTSFHQMVLNRLKHTTAF